MTEAIVRLALTALLAAFVLFLFLAPVYLSVRSNDPKPCDGAKCSPGKTAIQRSIAAAGEKTLCICEEVAR